MHITFRPNQAAQLYRPIPDKNRGLYSRGGCLWHLAEGFRSWFRWRFNSPYAPHTTAFIFPSFGSVGGEHRHSIVDREVDRFSRQRFAIDWAISGWGAMPLFLSDDEFARCSGDAALVAEKADEFIKKLFKELETVKAESDAASITAEQTCSLLEQKYLSLSSEFSELQSRCAQLQSSLDERLSELADVQAQKHQHHLQCVTHPHLGNMPLVIFSVI